MDPVRFPSLNPVNPELGGGLAPAKPSGPSFGEALEAAVQSVSHVQKASDEATKMYALGREVDLHTVLLQVEKADISFRTMMEVRNKLLDAYREVMRIQI
jgi:flagellar hook-basal body complex protein FliE